MYVCNIYYKYECFCTMNLYNIYYEYMYCFTMDIYNIPFFKKNISRMATGRAPRGVYLVIPGTHNTRTHAHARTHPHTHNIGVLQFFRHRRRLGARRNVKQGRYVVAKFAERWVPCCHLQDSAPNAPNIRLF